MIYLCASVYTQIPLNIDEVCYIEFSDIRGITLGFDRESDKMIAGYPKMKDGIGDTVYQRIKVCRTCCHP